MSHNLRRLKHENVTDKFDANRGAEGQIKARKNAKGEVELVAFFGGKWFYCPMAEFNKTLNLRKGSQVDGQDIMSANQKGSSGFASVRLDATSGQLAPKLNECKMFVDTIPATADTRVALTDGTQGNNYFTYGPDTVSEDVSTIKLGLNVTQMNTATVMDTNSYIVGIETEAGDTWDYATDVAFTDATCDTNSGTTVAHNANAAIKIGMLVTGSGIPSNSYVDVKNSTTQFILSAAATTSLTDTTLTFTPRPYKFYISTIVNTNWSNKIVKFQTIEETVANAFLNIVYQDSAGTYYQKIQLNTANITPFGATYPIVNTTSASGGTGTNKVL